MPDTVFLSSVRVFNILCHSLSLQAELREEILQRNLTKIETRSSIEHSVRKKYEREMAALREQCAHLSCTLASIQERLSKANNKIHRQQLEITSLRCNPCGTIKTSECYVLCVPCLLSLQLMHTYTFTYTTQYVRVKYVAVKQVTIKYVIIRYVIIKYVIIMSQLSMSQLSIRVCHS